MTEGSDLLAAYAAEAPDLAPRFEAISSADLLKPVLKFLPDSPADVADIGAGTGRDAAWLASFGHRVTAVEPVAALARYGKENHPNTIEWISDSLPDLDDLCSSDRRFDFILVCSVWHHLSATQSARSLQRITQLLHPNARLALSLKVFGNPAKNSTQSLSLNTIQSQATAQGLVKLHQHRASAHQDYNRLAGNSWDWVVFTPEQPGSIR